jgi:hypothetical protein
MRAVMKPAGGTNHATRVFMPAGNAQRRQVRSFHRNVRLNGVEEVPPFARRSACAGGAAMAAAWPTAAATMNMLNTPSATTAEVENGTQVEPASGIQWEASRTDPSTTNEP